METNKVKSACGKCSGKGRIEGFGHIDNGRCFACGGAGWVLGEPVTNTALVNRHLHDAAVVASFIQHGCQDKAQVKAQFVARDLFKIGTANAKAVLNRIVAGDVAWNDAFPGGRCAPALGRAAAELIIAAGKELKGV